MTRNFIDEFEYEDIAEMEYHICYYFKGSKDIIQEMFPSKYDDATSTELSIEKYPENEEISVSISPCLEEDGFSTDYDWNDIDIPDEVITGLMAKVPKEDLITDEMIDVLKKEILMGGVDAIEDFLDSGLCYMDDNTLDGFMDDVIAQMPKEDFMKYYEKYVTNREAIKLEAKMKVSN